PPGLLGAVRWGSHGGAHFARLLSALEGGQPIALLAERKAETLSTWLQAHPGVEVICRDRGGAYAEGAREGAPAALQVADRFHLLQNMVASLEGVLKRSPA